MRKKAIFYGNCTAMAIAEILRNCSQFNENYEIIFSKGVFLLTKQEKYELLALSEKADLLVHQPVVNFAPVNSEDIINKAHNAQIISYPVPYFTGYFPDITYLRNPQAGGIVHEPIDYHSRFILSAYIKGLSAEETSELYSSMSMFTRNWFVDHNMESLEQLAYRESKLDIQIVDFINQNYKKRQLFYSMNHPTDELLFYIIDAVLSRISLPYLSKELKKRYDGMFSEQQWPICKTAVKELDLGFQSRVVINAKETSIQEFVNMYYDYYSKSPEIVEFNKELIYKELA